MKTRSLSHLLPLVLLAAFICPGRAWSAGQSGETTEPIYDESRDGSEQIAGALEIAARDHKRVLLQFGANWCVWCHRLYDLYLSDPEISATLKAGFVLVLIDVNGGNNGEVDQKYGNPTRLGLPVIVVLKSDGRLIATKNTAELEKGQGHDPAKVLAFLQSWSPKARDTCAVEPGT
ncbi:MAG: thioredoxin family protein [Opitutaceae bacterium]